MVDATILNFENRSLFLNYWTNPNQIWWDKWELYKERIRFIKSEYLPKFEMASTNHLEFWKSVAIS